MFTTFDGDMPFRQRKRFGLALYTGLSLLAVGLLARRLAGAWQQFPPVPLALLFTGLCFLLGGLAALLLRDGDERRGKADSAEEVKRHSRGTRRRTIFAGRVITAVILPMLIGLTVISPANTAAQMAVVSTGLFLFYVLWWGPPATANSTTAPTRRTDGETDEVGFQRADKKGKIGQRILAGNLPAEEITGEATEPAKESAEFWMTRRPSADGSCEMVEGEATVRFAAGQQQAILHVAFCPPLCGSPCVDCQPLSEADLRWKIVTAAPYGLRIDLTRRTDLDSPLTVRMGYSVAAPVIRPSAA